MLCQLGVLNKYDTGVMRLLEEARSTPFTPHQLHVVVYPPVAPPSGPRRNTTTIRSAFAPVSITREG